MNVEPQPGPGEWAEIRPPIVSAQCGTAGQQQRVRQGVQVDSGDPLLQLSRHDAETTRAGVLGPGRLPWLRGSRGGVLRRLGGPPGLGDHVALEEARRGHAGGDVDRHQSNGDHQQVRQEQPGVQTPNGTAQHAHAGCSARR